MPPQPVVRFDAVSIKAGGRAMPPRPLGSSPLDFTLAPGSFHILTGAGELERTSVLRLVCLAERPAAGRVWLFGRDTGRLPRGEAPRLRRRTGLVLAEDRFAAHLSVFDNAALVPRLARRRPLDYEAQVEEVLAWVGLRGLIDQPPTDLSPGERRRLSIARALANRPDIVLADEPTGCLDPAEGEWVLRLLADINAAGTAVLMATGDQSLAEASGAPIIQLVKDGLAPAALGETVA